MQIKVTEKRVWGRLLYYPECALSRAITQIKGGMTLSWGEIETLRKGGLSCMLTDEKGEVMEYPPETEES